MENNNTCLHTLASPDRIVTNMMKLFLCNVVILVFFFPQAFEAKNDPLGVTLIGDLAEVDMPKIRSLALIELTALFDLYDITYSRPKRKKKPKGNGNNGKSA